MIRTYSLLIIASLALACGPSSGEHDGGDSGDDESGDLESDDGATETGDGEFRIIDQSGAQFGWECIQTGDDVDCEVLLIEGVSPPLPPCDTEGRFYGPLLGRFIKISGFCPLTVGYGLWEGRYLVCEEDADCPEMLDNDWTYECRAGLCQHTDTVRYPDGLPTWLEAFTLCEGYEPRNFGPIVGGPEDPVGDAIYAACSDQDYPYDPCESLPAFETCMDPR